MTCYVFTGPRVPDQSSKTALNLAFIIQCTPFSRGKRSCCDTFWADLQSFFLGSTPCDDENPAPLIIQSNSGNYPLKNIMPKQDKAEGFAQFYRGRRNLSACSDSLSIVLKLQADILFKAPLNLHVLFLIFCSFPWEWRF